MSDQTEATTAAICTWPSCGHTAKGQCGLTMRVATIAPRPDNADLIRRMKDEADSEEAMAMAVAGFGDLSRAERHADRAALLREAVKALEASHDR